MPTLTIYKLRNPFEGLPVQDFDRYLAQGREPDAYETIDIPGGEAKLYIWTSRARSPRWEGFLRTGWDVDLPTREPVGGLVIVKVRINRRDHYFGIPFGSTGRFILDQAAIERSFGLRTALNLMYPRSLGSSEEDATRVLGLDAKRRGRDVMRSRVQSSSETTFETFGVDQLRDVVDAATGRPVDTSTWGHRITGSDGLTCTVEEAVHGLGDVCRRIEEAHQQDDYRARFAWIDDVQPVNDPELFNKLQVEIIELIRAGAMDDLELAPPEIVDWTQVNVFRYHTDGHQNVKHRQLRLSDYRRALKRTGQLEDLNLPLLRNGFIKALDTNGDLVHQWSAWNALVGTVKIGSATYILENGEFFTVAPDFLAELDASIDHLEAGNTPLPSCGVNVLEGPYNSAAAAELGILLMDKETVSIPSKTTEIEVSDLLTPTRELIHVKREFGARDLSHLFSQGTTSAELIHDDQDFRSHVQKKVIELAGDTTYAFFDDAGISPPSFRVTYAVIGNWKGQTSSERLSFFSKVNLRRAATDLKRRGFVVGFQRVNQDM